METNCTKHLQKKNKKFMFKMEFRAWVVTGTFHGIIVYCHRESTARESFHDIFNGESIISIYSREIT
jgi:hypothetical protein